MLTKVQAIRRVLEDLNGLATWEQIYENIQEYYPTAKDSKEWKAGIRGVLYREIKRGRNFKRVGLGIYALEDYQEEEKPRPENKKRMHSYMEGICLRIGNFQGFMTYTPDKSSIFADGIRLGQFVTLQDMPSFTYPEIVNIVRRIDVLWFNDTGFKFPKYAFEVVHSAATLADALTRCVQLLDFDTAFAIVGPQEHKSKFTQQMKLQPFVTFADRFEYKQYESVMEFYDRSVEIQKVRKGFFTGT